MALKCSIVGNLPIKVENLTNEVINGQPLCVEGEMPGGFAAVVRDLAGNKTDRSLSYTFKNSAKGKYSFSIHIAYGNLAQFDQQALKILPDKPLRVYGIVILKSNYAMTMDISDPIQIEIIDIGPDNGIRITNPAPTVTPINPANKQEASYTDPALLFLEVQAGEIVKLKAEYRKFGPEVIKSQKLSPVYNWLLVMSTNAADLVWVRYSKDMDLKVADKLKVTYRLKVIGEEFETGNLVTEFIEQVSS